MRYDDFMFYFADIFVESVQYGGRTKLCDMIKHQLIGKFYMTWLPILKKHADKINVSPSDYDTLIALTNTTVDTRKSGRQWQY